MGVLNKDLTLQNSFEVTNTTTGVITQYDTTYNLSPQTLVMQVIKHDDNTAAGSLAVSPQSGSLSFTGPWGTQTLSPSGQVMAVAGGALNYQVNPGGISLVSTQPSITFKANTDGFDYNFASAGYRLAMGISGVGNSGLYAMQQPSGSSSPLYIFNASPNGLSFQTPGSGNYSLGITSSGFSVSQQPSGSSSPLYMFNVGASGLIYQTPAANGYTFGVGVSGMYSGGLYAVQQPSGSTSPVFTFGAGSSGLTFSNTSGASLNFAYGNGLSAVWYSGGNGQLTANNNGFTFVNGFGDTLATSSGAELTFSRPASQGQYTFNVGLPGGTLNLTNSSGNGLVVSSSNYSLQFICGTNNYFKVYPQSQGLDLKVGSNARLQAGGSGLIWESTAGTISFTLGTSGSTHTLAFNTVGELTKDGVSVTPLVYSDIADVPSDLPDGTIVYIIGS